MERAKISPRLIALAGGLAAVALVIQLLASLIPSGWTAMAAVAGLAVAVAVSAAGYMAGILCYVVSGVLSLLLLPAKHVVILFVCLFGIYPLVKSLLERLKVRAAEYLLKLVFFNLVFSLLYLLAYQIFFQSAAEAWSYPVPFLPILFVAGNVIFLIYDYAFSKVMSLIQARLIPQLRRRFVGR